MYTVEVIKAKLSSDQRWIERAIIVLHERQTREEQQSEVTIEANGVGFNAFDAKRLSYYANWLLGGKHLSGKHLEQAKRALPKYAKQILSLINHQ
jgi:hypothetical protein